MFKQKFFTVCVIWAYSTEAMILSSLAHTGILDALFYILFSFGGVCVKRISEFANVEILK